MIDDALGEVVAEAAGAVVQVAGGFIADLAVAYVFSHVFSGNTARFFHSLGRRVIAIATGGRIRIPSSLRTVPRGVRARPRRSDWLALWTGVAIWLSLFLALCLIGWELL